MRFPQWTPVTSAVSTSILTGRLLSGAGRWVGWVRTADPDWQHIFPVYGHPSMPPHLLPRGREGSLGGGGVQQGQKRARQGRPLSAAPGSFEAGATLLASSRTFPMDPCIYTCIGAGASGATEAPSIARLQHRAVGLRCCLGAHDKTPMRSASNARNSSFYAPALTLYCTNGRRSCQKPAKLQLAAALSPPGRCHCLPPKPGRWRCLLLS